MSRRAFAIVATCAALAAPALAVGPALAAPHAAKTPTITVTADDFKSTQSSAPKGAVTFEVTNKGKTAHDFKIDGKKTALLQAGKKASLTVTFAKAGKFPYLCTVPGHAKLGMKGTFTVT